jgi:hypothetical protein
MKYYGETGPWIIIFFLDVFTKRHQRKETSVFLFCSPVPLLSTTPSPPPPHQFACVNGFMQRTRAKNCIVFCIAYAPFNIFNDEGEDLRASFPVKDFSLWVSKAAATQPDGRAAADGHGQGDEDEEKEAGDGQASRSAIQKLQRILEIEEMRQFSERLDRLITSG